MKKWWLGIVTFLLPLISFAQANFLPLKPGNQWVYAYVDWDWTLREVIKTEVTDSFEIVNGKKYHWIVSSEINGWRSFSSARKNEIGQYVYAGGVPGPNWNKRDREIVYYDPLAEVGTVWNYKDTASVVEVKVSVSDQYQAGAFGEEVTVKVFNSDIGINGTHQDFCEKFGSLGGYQYDGVQFYLKGCVIDGVVYGDTTSVILEVNDQREKSKTIRLLQNYPNPFNPSTVIPFLLTQAGFVSIKIYDISGREIRTLFDGQKEPGNHKLTFDAEQLPSGVYLVRLSSGGISENRKILLVR